MIWQVLKTLLFSMVLVEQAVLNVLTFHNPPSSSSPLSSPPSTTDQSQHLAATLIHALYDLSFVSSAFGSITAQGGGFSEHKRTFFAGLDVVSTDSSASEALIKDLARKIRGSCLFHIFSFRYGADICSEMDVEKTRPLRLSRTAFYLACAEQLIGRLSEDYIEADVLPIAQPWVFCPPPTL